MARGHSTDPEALRVRQMKFQSGKYGYLFDTESHSIFFGNKDSQLQNLEAEFPQFEFFKVHQVHGHRCIEAQHSEPLIQADAHWTNGTGKALLISTADCMPILCYSLTEKKILAIHAGWRGIENRITLSSIESTFKSTNDLFVYIGPHILKDCFEIEAELAEKIIGPENHDLGFAKTSHSAGKVYLDLFSLLKMQLVRMGIESRQIHFFERNTVKDHDFHSYRRDRERSGRQLSFIVQK